MNDKDFLAKHFDSFVDNVLMDQDIEFWTRLLIGGDFAPDLQLRAGALAELRARTNGWRKRLELDAKLEAAQDRKVGEQQGMHDPHYTREWYDFIDRDEDYQEDFR